MELVVVLLTGLTTGGLTCLAVQGGLLASVVAARTNQVAAQPLAVVRTPVASRPSGNSSRRKQQRGPKQPAQPLPAEGAEAADGPLFAFLAAKLLAYTALGVLLGATGSLIGVSTTTRGWLQLFAGFYMVATALNLLDLHPAFRYFVLQPPTFLSRRVRLASKSSHFFAPAFLGLMTVFIPCGTTLAVEFFALSTGDPVYAGALMFAFTLGTMPVFFFLGRLTSRMEGQRQARFLGFTAAGVLLLGFLSINTAMNLLDYPLTYSELETKLAALPERITGQTLDDSSPASGAPLFAIASPTAGSAGAANTSTGEASTDAIQILRLDVKSTSYAPGRIEAKAGQPIRLELATKNTNGCTRAFTIPSLGVQKILPATGTTVIDLPAQKPGTIRFTCSMGMYSGSIVVS